MRKKITLWVLMLVSMAASATSFDTYFADKTMRLDYYHTGNAVEEHFAFEGIVSDGIWAGSTMQTIDELRLGKYFFEVVDPTTKEVLYSRGFSSIYGEWETTPDAKQNWGVYHESLRFPWPKRNVDIVLYKRNASHNFSPVWNYHVDLEDYRVNPATRGDYYNSYAVVQHGDPKKKVDIVVLSEGYSKKNMAKFKRDAERFAKVLLSHEPFASRKEAFNIYAVEVPAPEDGLNHPHQEIDKRSALSVTYGAFGSERYALGFDNKKIRNAAATVPYEFTVLMMNDSIYGGGGIYNLYITAAADNAFKDYLFVHEFGHHFADLADEYYTSATAYEMNTEMKEPWELNVTTITDPEKIKWKELVTDDTPLPTPWEKEVYDKHSVEVQKERVALRRQHVPESVMEKLFLEKKAWDDELLSTMKYSGSVGAFEGAQYKAKGMYRSQANCIMFTRYDHFCAACQRAINMVIDQYAE